MLTKLRSVSREVVPVHLYGNVSIDPSAVIAPGVLLQSEADSRIAIGAGVCIGAGTIVQAAGGNLYIEAGACIGRGVLIIGAGSIDRDACIGAGTTAINPQIEAGAVIPKHSLLGDRSRNAAAVVAEGDLPTNLNGSTPTNSEPIGMSQVRPEPETADVWDTPTVNTAVGSTFFKVKTTQVSVQAENTHPYVSEQPTVSSPPQAVTTSPPPETAIEHQANTAVAGRAQFDRIKRALFPNSGTNDYTA
jgi:carbon dioxide concentrating mechanism protein CcmN